jgi:hypothetical protein
VTRPEEDVSDWPLLDELTGVHHPDPIAHARDDPEVVGDKHKTHRLITPNLIQQTENPRLNNDIKRSGRLVRKQ